VSNQLKTSFAIPNLRSRVIPDGVSLEIFTPTTKSDARVILGWDSENTYIIFYCGQRPIDKNLGLAERTIKELRAAYPLLQFIIVENDLSQTELALRFAGADALLFTSHAEGSPNVVREAIACGCPVVSVDVGDVRNWIDASGAGATCRYVPSELSIALRQTIDLKQRSKHEIAANFSTEATAVSIVDIYRHLEGHRN
jgi:glycosyltransferase involved in cell wall biosynthesis